MKYQYRTIYRDPITCLKPEGEVLLVHLLSDDGELQKWQVKFLEDGPHAQLLERFIRKDQIGGEQ